MKTRKFIIPVDTKKHAIDAAKEMAEEYRASVKEAKQALADMDHEAYQMHLEHMQSFLNMGFWDQQQDTIAYVSTYLTFMEAKRPFGILTINGWRG